MEPASTGSHAREASLQRIDQGSLIIGLDRQDLHTDKFRSKVLQDTHVERWNKRKHNN